MNFGDYGDLMCIIAKQFERGNADSTWLLALVHYARELRESEDPSYCRWKKAKEATPDGQA